MRLVREVAANQNLTCVITRGIAIVRAPSARIAASCNLTRAWLGLFWASLAVDFPAPGFVAVQYLLQRHKTFRQPLLLARVIACLVSNSNAASAVLYATPHHVIARQCTTHDIFMFDLSPHWDLKWTQNDPKATPKRSQNRSQNGPQTDRTTPKWHQIDPKLISQRSQNDLKLTPI